MQNGPICLGWTGLRRRRTEPFQRQLSAKKTGHERTSYRARFSSRIHGTFFLREERAIAYWFSSDTVFACQLSAFLVQISTLPTAFACNPTSEIDATAITAPFKISRARTPDSLPTKTSGELPAASSGRGCGVFAGLEYSPGCRRRALNRESAASPSGGVKGLVKIEILAALLSTPKVRRRCCGTSRDCS